MEGLQRDLEQLQIENENYRAELKRLQNELLKEKNRANELEKRLAREISKDLPPPPDHKIFHIPVSSSESINVDHPNDDSEGYFRQRAVVPNPHGIYSMDLTPGNLLERFHKLKSIYGYGKLSSRILASIDNFDPKAKISVVEFYSKKIIERISKIGKAADENKEIPPYIVNRYIDYMLGKTLGLINLDDYIDLNYSYRNDIVNPLERLHLLEQYVDRQSGTKKIVNKLFIKVFPALAGHVDKLEGAKLPLNDLVTVYVSLRLAMPLVSQSFQVKFPDIKVGVPLPQDESEYKSGGVFSISNAENSTRRLIFSYLYPGLYDGEKPLEVPEVLCFSY
ncbi:hypothetical protein HDV06_002266 [Boothiomyces sp. JEL0866]|nr:hypothetical protein HDV06_002266 [Boothiomyces sp. JEL0866]